MVFALMLIAVGIIALLVKLDVLSGSIWSYTWPAILIILGLSFLFGRINRRRSWRWFGCCTPWGDRDMERKE
ncbi:MAG: hypothetical protein A2Z29_10065 [Chloroflexi bacterium RBG_16_56_11]|nr:MAG: hypothetical protein A2Z29_10065 [Chloroflexi bacterium RBG_16_56_11]